MIRRGKDDGVIEAQVQDGLQAVTGLKGLWRGQLMVAFIF